MDISVFKQQAFSWKWWKSWINVVVGSILLAAAFVLFINPYHIVPGGVYGTGIILHYLIPSVQVGTWGFLLDVPLLLIAFRVFGGMFGARTIVSSVVIPIVMNSLTYMIGEVPSEMLGGRIDLSSDMFIAAIFGGLLCGIGIGLVVRTGATTGGTDIVAMILNRYTSMKFSRAMMMVDSAVVILGMIVLGDWRLPLYSLITIFVVSKTIDWVVDGASYDKLLFIVSDKHAEMEHFILDEMDRGATYIKSAGMYTKTPKEMIFLVISRRQVTLVQDRIREIDPTSFVVVVDAYETFGDGFKSFPEKTGAPA